MNKDLISLEEIKTIFKSSVGVSKYIGSLSYDSKDYQRRNVPRYSLLKVDFSIRSRIAHIDILQSQEYRTILRYVTQNYERYPIYSDWKTKEKTIIKTIKLTNLELESLKNNEDDLIRAFAEEIIIEINNEDLIPSWMIKTYLQRKLDNELNKERAKFEAFVDSQENKIFVEQRDINNFSNANYKYLDKLLDEQERENKLATKILKLSKMKKNLFKSIISFGIYSYLISDKRKNIIKQKLKEVKDCIIKLTKNIEDNKKRIEQGKEDIDKLKLEIKTAEKVYNDKKDSLNSDFEKKITKVKKLSDVVNEDDGFIDLKNFSGLSYEKIVGVYIIHNRENDKYYVGQSKDVMKRISQHFKGTTPKNSIFAEDYYTSQFPNRENIFEIKIIKCETKDELDKREKDLIREYDSWENGYNGTSGNI